MTTTTGPNQQPHYASASLYVGDLDPEVNEMTLYEIFSAIGQVASIRVCRESGTRRSLGYAYVNYQAISDAERSLDTLNYTPIKGVPCRIMWSHRDPALRRSGAGNVFVKNLDKIIDNKALHDTFSLFGNILSCKVATDEYGKSKGFGFVHYESDESAQAAIEKVNGMQIGSKTVYVGPFKKQTERPNNRTSDFTNVYVKQFPQSWTEDTIKSVFSKFGQMTSSVLSTDAKGRRFALMNFVDKQAAKDAVEQLHNRRTNAEGVLSEDTIESPDTASSNNTQTSAEKEEEITKRLEDYQDGIPKNKKTEDRTESRNETDNESKSEKTPEETKKELTELNMDKEAQEKKPEEDRLYVVRAMPRSERVAVLKEAFSNSSSETKSMPQGINLYVKNLYDQVTDEELREVFSKFGTVTSAKVMRDDASNSKGFGFVCFAFPEEATKAVTAMHLKIFHNKPLYVGLAEKRDSRIARLKARYRMSNTRPSATTTTNHPMMVSSQRMGPPVMGGYGTAAPTGGAPSVFYGPQIGGAARPPSAPSYGGVQPGVDPMLWRQQQRPYPGQGPMTPAYPYQMTTPGGIIRGNQQQRPPRSSGAPTAGGNFKFTPQARNQQEFPQVATPAGHGGELPILTAQALAAVHPQMQKQILGERLFPLVNKHQPELAGKITGMMLEMDNAELLALLDSEALVQAKVNEALGVLHRHHQGGAAPTLNNNAPMPQASGHAM